MPEPGADRDMSRMMAGFRAGAVPPDESDIAAQLCAGMDFARRHYDAGELIGLPPALFVARAYAACFGHPPARQVFAGLRDRLLNGETDPVRLLRELANDDAAKARGVHISGLAIQALRGAVGQSFAADAALGAARLVRNIGRLPRNLARARTPKRPAAPFAPVILPVAEGKRPRIAILSVAAGETGGAERFYGGLCDALNQAGMAAELVAQESPEQSFADTVQSYRRFYDLDLAAYDGVISAKAPTYAARHPNHVCYLMHTMRSWYDMFEASHPFASAGTRVARRKIEALDTAALQNVRKRFAIGAEVANRLAAYNGLAAEVMHLPSTLSGLREGPFTHLLLPGRLHPWKRVELAVETMRFVKSPIHLVIAGTGQEEARLRALAKGDSRIVFTGWVDEAKLASLYAEALAVLLLPRREDLGLVTFEAFAAGKPLITCSDSGEPARLVADGRSGFVCPPEPRVLAERIEFLAADPSRAAAMGQVGRAAVQAVSWEHVAQSLIAALGFTPR